MIYRYFVISLIWSMIIMMSTGGNTAMSSDNKECLKKLIIDRGDSPWKGMTGSYQEEADSMKIRAVRYKSSAHIQFENLKKYTYKGEPLIFLNREKQAVYVNSLVFSDINRGDSTRMNEGEKVFIGKYLRVADKLKVDYLMSFLIESQIIITYWHIGAELCLEKETAGGASYTAVYSGFHEYFTNSRNTGEMKFSLTLDRTTGDIYLHFDK